MSKAVEIEGYMLRVHTRHYDRVNGVIVCHKGENDKMFFPFRRPHGEWTSTGFGTICSVCGEALPFSDELAYETNFCPNCGAWMVKEGEENGKA